jgi:hypothetical protein
MINLQTVSGHYKRDFAMDSEQNQYCQRGGELLNIISLFKTNKFFTKGGHYCRWKYNICKLKIYFTITSYPSKRIPNDKIYQN